MRGARRRLRIVGLALVALLAIGAIGYGAWTRIIQPAMLPSEPSMPALSADLQKLQDYYHFRFLPDGYPESPGLAPGRPP